ncbi:MAG TPA: YtxH domain-containing protein [Armatimonadota bacterium]|jgi:gas vesicle protein
MAAEKNEFVIGILVGAALGAAAALLMAPAAGTETREQVKQKAQEAMDKANEVASQARVKANEVASQVRTTAQDWGDKGRDLVDKGKDLASKVRGTAEEAKDEMKGDIEEAATTA